MDPVRFGLVGYGFGGRWFHAPLLAAAPEVDLLGVVTTSAERRAQVAAEHPGLRTFGSLEELADAGAEAVAISTPADTHTALTEQALALGFAVVCDKPFALDAEAARGSVERAERLGLPILFHSGIFIDGRSGRFCRPTFYEAVREHPGLKVTLAHLGWPWCDEANAVGVIDLINGVAPDASQFRFDISFGPPPVYRREVLRRALAVLGPGLLQFGSDLFLPCSGQHIREMLDEVARLFDELEVEAPARARVMGGTAARWLRLSAT